MRGGWKHFKRANRTYSSSNSEVLLLNMIRCQLLEVTEDFCIALYMDDYSVVLFSTYEGPAVLRTEQANTPHIWFDYSVEDLWRTDHTFSKSRLHRTEYRLPKCPQTTLLGFWIQSWFSRPRNTIGLGLPCYLVIVSGRRDRYTFPKGINKYVNLINSTGIRTWIYIRMLKCIVKLKWYKNEETRNHSKNVFFIARN